MKDSSGALAHPLDMTINTIQNPLKDRGLAIHSIKPWHSFPMIDEGRFQANKKKESL